MPQTAHVTERDPELEAQLSAQLDGASLGQPVHAFRAVGSTMDVAHGLARQGAPEGALVWALRQEQGRGRQGRAWVSPEGGLYCSLVLRPRRSVEEVPQLSLVAGLAAAEAIQALSGLSPVIRWPNDLLLGDRKVAGILTEARNAAVVIGIGVNVMTQPTDLPESATSLAAAGKPADVRRLTGELCRRLARWYDAWSRQGFAAIRETLRPWIGLFGQVVHITAGSDRFEGTATDLDESGRFLVRLDSGVVRAFDMGEVTLLQ